MCLSVFIQRIGHYRAATVTPSGHEPAHRIPEEFCQEARGQFRFQFAWILPCLDGKPCPATLRPATLRPATPRPATLRPATPRKAATTARGNAEISRDHPT